jgi:four helix bundle protein
MENENKRQIKSFKDLDVYQRSYNAMMKVFKEVLTELPDSEKYDLKDQLSRSTKAVPRLIAEGYAKRHQKAGFQKYLDDALAESNETIVGLEQCADLYNIDNKLIEELVNEYVIISKQLYKLSIVWTNFQKPITVPVSKPNNHKL